MMMTVITIIMRPKFYKVLVFHIFRVNVKFVDELMAIQIKGTKSAEIFAEQSL